MRSEVALVMVLFCGACVSTRGRVRTPYTETTVEDFDPAQRRVLESTLGAMATLAPGPLVIDADEYRRTTRFSSVFGFALDGARLARWWAERVTHVRRGSAWTIAVYAGDHTIVVTDEFFERTLLERVYVLVHEARHADGDGYRHVDCPHLSSPACDDRPDGAYTYQAALLYELYAYGLLDAAAAHRAWKTASRRIVEPSR